jgi:hypothetical protein
MIEKNMNQTIKEFLFFLMETKKSLNDILIKKLNIEEMNCCEKQKLQGRIMQSEIDLILYKSFYETY